MYKPPKLNPGDTVATITLSWGGPATFPHRYVAGKRQLEETFGVKVIESKYALANADWLWRNPQARADDLMETLANPEVKAIISTIGGDDSIRILPYLDPDVIRQNPKIFMGYSDTTITHFAFYHAGVVSFQGPAIMAGFGENGGLFPYMVESVRRTLFSVAPIGVIRPNDEGWTVEHKDWSKPESQSEKRTLNPATGWRWLQGEGVASGHLVGGCFEILDFLRGTEWWLPLDEWQEAILFLETSEDMPSPTQVGYFLRTLGVMGVLEQLSALLFARPGGATLPIEAHADYDNEILRIVRDEFGLSDLPIVTGMDFGHTDPMFVMPYGVAAEIDCEQQEFRIVESAVS
jgi:muramoyltetrapeptide carboxypeptidase LdcA involved in peptidoglycan recycling